MIYVNDLVSFPLSSRLLAYADDLKCSNLIRELSDCARLQEDLDGITDWSHKWKINFKAVKCVHLQFSRGSTNFNHTYSIDAQQIPVKTEHRDLGLIVSSDLSWNSHYCLIASRAYRLIGLLRRTFKSVDSVLEKKRLYLSLIRSQLLYCSQVWRPQLIKDILMLEKVQRRATKFILNDYTSDYRARLVKLKLLPLMYHLELNDILFCVKSLKAPASHFDIREYISFSTQSTRSGSHNRMCHSRSFSQLSHHFLFNRIPRLWNSFPPLDLELSITTIKIRLVTFLRSHSYIHTS